MNVKFKARPKADSTTEETTTVESAESIMARLKKNAKSFFVNTKQAIKNKYRKALALRELRKAKRIVKRAEKRAAKSEAKSEKSESIGTRFWRHGKKNLVNTYKWLTRILKFVTAVVLGLLLIATIAVAAVNDVVSASEAKASAYESVLKNEKKQAKEDRKAKRAEKKTAKQKSAEKKIADDLVAAAEEVEVTVVNFTADEVSEVVNGTERSEDIDIVTRELLEKHLETLGADLERKYAAAHNGNDTKEASYLFGQLAAFYVWQQCFIKREDFSPLKAHDETLAEAAKHGYDVKVAEQGYEYGEVIAKLAESLGIEESVYAL